MQYYIYKVTFKDLPGYFYYGKHKDNGKPYLGSPKTWEHLWNQFEPQLHILQWYETAEEAEAAERSVILVTWGDKYSLNENAGGCFSEGVCRKNGKAVMAKMSKEAKADRAANLLAHENTRKARSANGRATGAANGRAGSAKIPKETRVANAAAMNAHENTQKARAANAAALNSYENTKKNRADNGKNSTSQRWQCLVTGFITNPGNLSKYQKAKGIDASLRKRVG